MKIDKHSPSHWLYLVLFAAHVALALMARPFRRGRGRKNILLYGHKLNGNLLAIYRELKASPDFDVTFLTMDPTYQRELQVAGVTSRLATSPACLPVLVSADAVISDHGLHALLPMLFLSDLKFFDAWHGIPFKGFDGDDFRVQRRYDETWVSSPLLRKMYIERFGFAPDAVAVTGYARTDRLIRRDEDRDAIKRGLGLDAHPDDRIVLFAPTWKQDARDRSMYPFDMEEDMFLGRLSELGRRIGATFLLRGHLNTSDSAGRPFDRIVRLPTSRFPDTESILLISDLLVCDWSSIAFDFLLLDRPTIFLDVEPPFSKGLSLDATYRFGAIAHDMEELTQLLTRYLAAPADYREDFASATARVRDAVYGRFADGAAAARCVDRVRHHLGVARGE